MARSPAGRLEGQSADDYRRAWSALYRLMLSGSSWSGHERNCWFLNLGNSRFCDVAAASGLDFLQDGRAVALVDWDHDGKLDLWITNRNAPRVRFIRNTMRTANRFLAVRLTGTKCNRDAIGARLEVHLAGDPGGMRRRAPIPAGDAKRTLHKSLRAGEGFLSQSSKWVHFGLGPRDRIEKLVVRWPGGDASEYRQVTVDRRYDIVQGSPPREWSPPNRAPKLAASRPVVPIPTDTARIVILERKDVPTLHYESFDGQPVEFDRYRGRPLLINVWATWCAPCITELSDFRDHVESLRAEGLNIVAISVDGLRDGEKRDAAAVRAVCETRRFPFDVGMAPEATVRLLERGPGVFLNRNAPLPIPSSFLIDENGKIAVIYNGPVTAKQLQNDLKLLNSSPGHLLQATVPFPGRWLDDRRAKLLSPPEIEDEPGPEDSRHFPSTAILVAGAIAGMLVLFAAVKRRRRRLATGKDAAPE